MSWSPALGAQFIRISYEIQSEKTQKPMFQGAGYYKALEAGKFKAFWADSTGDLHPILATRDGNTLTSIWGVAGEKLGRTEYNLIAPDKMQVTDWIMREHEWQQFNQNTFIRSE